MPKLRDGRYLDLLIYSGRASDGGRGLADLVKCRYLRQSNRRRVARLAGSLCINWGNTSVPDWLHANRLIVVNAPVAVSHAISKVYTYGKFKEAGVPTLEFTTSSNDARGWVGEGHSVLARRDRLSSGAGITIIEKGSAWNSPNADFFAKYFPKTHEYRVHVFKGRVIDITQKKRSVEPESDNDRTVYQRVVRSLENGWIHAHDGLHLPDSCRVSISDACIRAVDALGLDFGAVDVLAQYSKKAPNTLKAFAVCEVNTAPGLGNTATLNAYKAAIEQLYKDTAQQRFVEAPVRVKKVKRKRVRKMVRVLITTRKGNKVYRDRERWVYE